MKKTLTWISAVVIILIGGNAFLNGVNKSSSVKKETRLFSSFNPFSRDDKDCSDFNTQRNAQEFFEANGGPGSDPHNLDRDKDGKVCESLK